LAVAATLLGDAAVSSSMIIVSALHTSGFNRLLRHVSFMDISSSQLGSEINRRLFSFRAFASG